MAFIVFRVHISRRQIKINGAFFLLKTADFINLYYKITFKNIECKPDCYTKVKNTMTPKIRLLEFILDLYIIVFFTFSPLKKKSLYSKHVRSFLQVDHLTFHLIFLFNLFRLLAISNNLCY